MLGEAPRPGGACGRRWRAGTLLGACLLVGSAVQGQTKLELQRQRDAIEEQLSTTERLLSKATSNRTDAAAELRLVDSRIELRERLVEHHRTSLVALERQMNGTDSEIRMLEGHVAATMDEYARMVLQAYRISLAHNPWLYVLAADDFNQAALRFRLLQDYSGMRKDQIGQIQSAQEELGEKRGAMEQEADEIEKVLAELGEERARLESDWDGRKELVDRLKGEEAQLRSRQRKAEAERERLSAEIRNMIEAELAAERASAEGEFALTPEGRIVSAEFERNKAGLPWPVLRGVVTQRFGRQAHPTLPGIFIDNNGVDISTDENTAVLAAFDGEVTSIFEIPGAGATVILSHGAYRSVYSNVHSIAVQKGSKVDVGQVLAKTRGGNAGAVLHFEIWHVSEGGQTPQAPRLWLVPR